MPRPYPVVPGTPRWQRAFALLLMCGALTLMGCGGGDNNNPFAPATITEASNRAFTFATGATATLAASFGLAANQPFTLQFGSFGGTTVAPVTLDIGTSVATGTVTLLPCVFRFDRSTFPNGSGPQTGQTITIDPCELHRDDKTLRLIASASQMALSQREQPVPSTNVALVFTGDGLAGSFTVVDLRTQQTFKDLNPGQVQSDAVARLFKGRVYVLNRTRAESVQVLDPSLGFLTPPGATLALAQGSAPQDIAFLSETKAYVSLLTSPRLLVINPTTLARVGEIDLSPLRQAADPDGSPEPTALLLNNGLLYIALRHLDRTQTAQPAVARGTVAVLDTTTDRLIATVALRGSNPVSELVFSPTLNRILVSTAGQSASDAGGLEAINPETLTAEATLLASRAALGGAITTFVIVSRDKGFAVVQETPTTQALITFNPVTGQRLARLTSPVPGRTAHLAINSNQQVYVAFAETTSTPGVRIVDATTDQEITTTPLHAGLFAPRYTVFLE